MDRKRERENEQIKRWTERERDGPNERETYREKEGCAQKERERNLLDILPTSLPV